MTDNDLESELYHEEDPVQRAQRFLKEAAPFAAATISNMCTDDTIAPTVRLRAAQYVIDRNLGPVGKEDGKEDLLESFLEELQDVANGKAPRSSRR